jgi:hypothetical protein
MGQPDINDHPFANNPNVGEQVFGRISPSQPGVTSDELKFSNSQNGHIQAEEIVGGKEDCVDINNGSSDLHIVADSWKSGGLYVATIKGQSSRIALNGWVDVHGSVVDLDVDNYSDQKHAPSQDIYCGWRTRDGSPIRWRSWMGCRPRFAVGQPTECLFCLPAPLGFVVNRGYQLLKLLKLTT